MNHKDCKSVQEELERLASRSLSGAELAALEAHLQVCPACSQLVSRSRKLADLLCALPRKNAPEGMFARVYERVLEQDEESGFTAQLTEKISSLARRSAPQGEFQPPVEEDSPLAQLVSSLPHVSAPAALDRSFQRSLSEFVWSRSRTGRVFRLVAGSLAAAASLLLCLTFWVTGKEDLPESTTPRFVYRDVDAPPAFWATNETSQAMIHGVIPTKGGRQR